MKLTNTDLEPADKRISTAKNRNLFLSAIEKISPELIENLYSQVFPVYKKAREKGWNPVEFEEIEFDAWGPDVDDRFIARRNLKAALLEWAERWNIKWAKENVLADWIFDQALGTLYLWAIGYKNKRGWGIYQGWSACFPIWVNEQLFVFRHNGWPIDVKPWETFEKEIRAAFEKQLKEYRERLVRLAKTRGWSAETPEIRKPESYIRRFEWLVLYQIKGWKIDSIIDHYSQDRDEPYDYDTVRKQINDAAKLVGLKLVNKQGRPRKLSR